MPGWTPVPLSTWEGMPRDRKVIAIFRPRATERPFAGLNFEYQPEEDDAGFAIVRLPSGNVVAFVDRRGHPISGTLLLRVESAVSDEELIEEVCQSGNLSSADLKWAVWEPMDRIHD